MRTTRYNAVVALATHPLKADRPDAVRLLAGVHGLKATLRVHETRKGLTEQSRCSHVAFPMIQRPKLINFPRGGDVGFLKWRAEEHLDAPVGC